MDAQGIYHNLLINPATSWPHWDHEFPENIEHLSNRGDLSPEDKMWLMSGTAKKLYKLYKLD